MMINDRIIENMLNGGFGRAFPRRRYKLSDSEKADLIVEKRKKQKSRAKKRAQKQARKISRRKR